MSSQTHLPELPPGMTRTIYVSGLDPVERESLEEAGYRPVELMTLPRDTEQQEVAYLKAKLQAMEEKTIPFGPEDRMQLELALKANGLLTHGKKNLNVSVNLDGKTVDELLGWDDDRHTLATNSTVQSALRGKQ